MTSFAWILDSLKQNRRGFSAEVGSTNLQPVVFDMDPIGGKKGTCTKYPGWAQAGPFTTGVETCSGAVDIEGAARHLGGLFCVPWGIHCWSRCARLALQALLSCRVWFSVANETAQGQIRETQKKYQMYMFDLGMIAFFCIFVAVQYWVGWLHLSYIFIRLQYSFFAFSLHCSIGWDDCI